MNVIATARKFEGGSRRNQWRVSTRVKGALARVRKGASTPFREPQRLAGKNLARPVSAAKAQAWTSGGWSPKPVMMAQICSRCELPCAERA